MSEYFTEEDFELLSKWGGQQYSKNNSDSREVNRNLKNVFTVLYSLANAIKDELFPNGVVSPKNDKLTDRTGTKFRTYIWQRMYPEKASPEMLVYEVSINSDKVLKVAFGIYERKANVRQKRAFNQIISSNHVVSSLAMDQCLELASIEKLRDWAVKEIQGFELSYEQVAEQMGLNVRIKDINTFVESDSRTSYTKNLPSDLNIILYGPPGTGKTFQLKEVYFPMFTDKGKKTKEQFAEELVVDLSWWQALAIALYGFSKPVSVSEILSHPIVVAKAGRAYNKTPRNSVWSSLQIHTKEDCTFVRYNQRTAPLVFSKDDNALWDLDRQVIELEFPELVKVSESLKSFSPVEFEFKRYRFVTFHQSFCYEDFVEGIKPILSEETANQESEQIAYTIKPGIFRILAEEARSNPIEKYALFIDEINRGNVANIFGELITFIEKDKRLNEDGDLKASTWKVDHLPYSRAPFGVPQNLYIIGTMNTADRSIEALDSALRRRFSFIPVYPKAELLKDRQPVNFDVDLEKLLKAINERLEILLDRDHTVGHSFFWDIKDSADPLFVLRKIFANSIIPQFQEYFYDNPTRIGMVLGPNFVRSKPSAESKLAVGEWDPDDAEEKGTYEIVPQEEWTLEAFKSIYGE